MKTLKHKKIQCAEPSKEPMDWYEADRYCKSLGEGWRLPAIKELQSIVSHKRCKPAIKKKFIKKFGNAVSNCYWSSTTFVDGVSDAWVVSLGYGYVNYANKPNNAYVWPVRDIAEEIKPIEKLYGVIQPNYRIPAQIHHSLDRLKKVNDMIHGYKIVEYVLKED